MRKIFSFKQFIYGFHCAQLWMWHIICLSFRHHMLCSGCGLNLRKDARCLIGLTFWYFIRTGLYLPVCLICLRDPIEYCDSQLDVRQLCLKLWSCVLFAASMFYILIYLAIDPIFKYGMQGESESKKCNKWAPSATFPGLHCVGPWTWVFGWPTGALI